MNLLDQLGPVPDLPDVPARENKRVLLGLSQGLPFGAFLASLFEANRLAPPNKRLTDKQLLAYLAQEYPTSKTVQAMVQADPKQRLTLNNLRHRYHAGTLNRVVPEHLSPRYNEKGEAVDSFDRVIHPKLLEQQVKAQRQRFLKTN